MWQSGNRKHIQGKIIKEDYTHKTAVYKMRYRKHKG